MNMTAAAVYWVIVAIWLTIVCTALAFYFANRATFRTTKLLLLVMAFDGFRNVIENTYFGLYFGSKFGFFSPAINHTLGKPELIILPKFANIAAGCVVLVLLLWKWLPAAIREHSRSESDAIHLKHIATTDWMTGLPNRRRFSEEMEAALTKSQSGQGNYSVFLLDIDGFKKVNDVHGHHVGDAVLREVARRLSLSVRRHDLLARLGGDEFAIIVDGAINRNEDEGDERLASRLVDAVRKPISMGSSAIQLGVSVGIVSCRTLNVNVDGALHAADMAMYCAKQNGGNSFRIFEPSMADETRDRGLLEKDLAGAIQDRKLEAFYQPVMDIASNRISAFEILARWNDPNRGLVSPEIFIPVAEHLGLISGVTTTMLQQACRNAKQWPRDIRFALNISPIELLDPLLATRILLVLAEGGVSPARLEIEITETDLVSDLEIARETLSVLQASGVTVSLDDFGKGYCSLHYLRQLQCNKLKIDRSFVQTMHSDASSEKIVDAVLGLAESLNLSVVAEGIESPEVLTMLKHKKCNFGQGYFIGKPMSADDAFTFVNESVPSGLNLATSKVRAT
jgi:diguanylate cyclase (GGDEF)-like protein